MSQDLSQGDVTPKLARASAIDTAKALNLWYKFIELSDDFTNPVQFNKATLVLGSSTVKNTATDVAGLKFLTTTNTTGGQIRTDETNSLFRIDANDIPLVLNATLSTSRISLRVNNAQIAQVTSTGLGIGVTPAEQLSVGTSINNTSASISIYSLTSAGESTYTSLTQGTNATLTVAYGRGTSGTGRHLIFSSNTGAQAFLSVSGNFGLGTLDAQYQAYAGARYLSVRGTNAPGALELWNNASDASGLITGAVYSSDPNSSAADKRLGALEFGTEGTAVNNRGGYARIMVKTEGASGVGEALRVNQVRQVIIGTTAAFSVAEMLRIHKSTGARISLTDANGACFVASAPVSASSELVLGAAGVEAVRVDQNLQVGINTTTPQAKFDIGGAAGTSKQAILARGSDINFQLVARNGSGVNALGETVFTLGSEYSTAGTQLTGGLQFVRGGASPNMTLNLFADSTKVMSFNQFVATNYTNVINAATTGRISLQTNTTTAGLVIQPHASGVDGTDGAFITFRNKAGTKAFTVGMDLDGEFRVGGGSIGSTAYKVLHEGYNPGAMVNRGAVAWTDVDIARPTGFYALANAANTASFALFDFANTSGSSARVQMMFEYGGGGGAGSQDEMYFRVARDTQTGWDGWGITSNRMWHSGNLINPVTTSTDYTTPSGIVLRAVIPPVMGQAWISSPPYGTSPNQGDNRTHFGYMTAAGNYENYIRGKNTYVQSDLQFVSVIDNAPGGTVWQISGAAWNGSGPALTNNSSVAGIIATATTGNSQLFTFSSTAGQMSVQMDGTMFIGESISYNPYGANASSGGYLVVAQSGSFGGNCSAANAMTAGYFRSSKGAPTASDGSTVGYAFGNDGDTGLFSVGLTGSYGNDGVSLFADNIEVLRCTNSSASVLKPLAVGQVTKKVASINNATGAVTHDVLVQTCFYHNQPTANFTVALVNVTVVAFQTVTVELVIIQGATGYIPNGMTINGAAVTIKWENGIAPTPGASNPDKAIFELIYTGSAWTVLGSYRRFG